MLHPVPARLFRQVVRAVAVYEFLALPTGRAAVLLGYPAAAPDITRLIVFGVLSAL